VTTLAGRPVISVAATARDTGRAAPPTITDPVPNDWLLVVGRTPEGRVVSSAGLFGGRAVRRCGNESLAELVLGVALHDSFAGAGLFNLDGQLVGMVVRCAGQMAAIPMAEVTRLVTTATSVAARVLDGYGFAVSPLDSLARAYFASDSGVLVVTVRQDAPAASALRPGDVILGVDDQRVAAPDDLAALVGDPPAEHDVVRRRGKSDARVRILRRDAVVGTPTDSARSADAGIRLAERLPPEGVIIDAVRAESPAGRAGLRGGDRLLEVGGRAVHDPRTARRLLERREGATLVVFERDSAQRGVLLPR
jgi:S1-C subfamily serine protease